MEPAPDDVSFELERFGGAAEDRLEVAGRWVGVRRRLARPTLVVVVDGRRRRLRTLPGAWSSSADGWEAAFAWQGGPVELDGAELEVGRSIVVDLPRPRRLRPSAPVESAEVHEEREVPKEPEPEPSTKDKASRQTESKSSEENTRLTAELEAARGEAAETRAALEREQEELAIARRALSAARESEEDERKETESVRSALETLRAELETLNGEQEKLRGEHDKLRGEHDKLTGEHERQAEQLAGARSELAAAEDRVAAAVTAGREEAQHLHEELASARTSLELPEPQTEAAAPAGRFAPIGSEDRTRPDGSDRDDEQERPRARRLDSALSDERPRSQRFEPARPDERGPALVGNRATSVTERAAAWASGAAERARRVVAGDTSPGNGSASRATEPSPARVRARPQRVRVRSPQRAPELEPQSEPSWALRAVAVGLVSVLLIALALIVSFLT